MRTYDDTDDCCCIEAGTAAEREGLAGLALGTNTGAFTACAGRAALGVGESGGLVGNEGEFMSQKEMQHTRMMAHRAERM